jgi:hypothetical protein
LPAGGRCLRRWCLLRWCLLRFGRVRSGVAAIVTAIQGDLHGLQGARRIVGGVGWLAGRLILRHGEFS